MESVFPPEQLVTLEDGKLPAGFHEPARSLLTTVGLPDDRSSFFVLDGGLFGGETPNRFRRCSELRYFSRYTEMSKGWGNWLVIGGIFDDVVTLDPVSGAVYCLPDGEYQSCAYTLNQSLDSFLHFLYLLELERPNYDFTVSDDIPDSEGVAESLRERMIRADSLPFEGVEPAWSEDFDWEAEDAPRMPAWDVVLSNVYESIG